MATRAVVDVYGIDMDMEQTPMVCRPVVCLYVPGFQFYQGYLPGADYPATPAGSAGANAAIVAGAKTLLEGAPYYLEFESGDIVQLARGVSGL